MTPYPTAPLQKYIVAFSRLKRGGTRYGVAPHKPVFLLSLIEQVEKGYVTDNRFYLTPELVGSFLENWRLLVSTPHQADITQPLYYLQSDKAQGTSFWFLIPQAGSQIPAHVKSVNTLHDILAYGSLSEDLFVLLLDPTGRAAIQHALLKQYFADTQSTFIQHKQIGEGFLQQVEEYVLNEPQAQLKKLSIHTEEEIFVRSGLFKRYIPQVYQDTCAFTGMRLISTFGHNFIDACHIVPFSISHDDRVNNGIALCPNMHRAFDRGLVGIDESYRIIVSPHFVEDKAHTYSLGRLHGKPVHLPRSEKYLPHTDNLIWHRENVFKG